MNGRIGEGGYRRGWSRDDDRQCRPALVTKRSETGANLAAEERRLFPRREVAAFGQPVVVNQLGVGLFGQLRGT